MKDNRKNRKWNIKLPELKLPARIAIYLCVALLLLATVRISMAKEGNLRNLEMASNTVSDNLEVSSGSLSDAGIENAPDFGSVSEDSPELQQEDPESVSDTEIPSEQTPEQDPAQQPEQKPETGEQGKEPDPDEYYEETVSENTVITSFIPLSKTDYTVKLGTAKEGIGLPDTITANTETTITTVYRIYETTDEPETDNLPTVYDIEAMEETEKSNLTYREESKTETRLGVKTLPVSWECPSYEEKTAGNYTFSVIITQETGLQYKEGVRGELPSIAVQIGESKPVILNSDLDVMARADNSATIITVNKERYWIFCNGYPVTLQAGDGNKTKFMYMNQSMTVTGLTGSPETGYEAAGFDVFGGTYNSAVNETNLTMTGGSIKGLYGGNREGTVKGNVNLKVTGGTMQFVVAGGHSTRIEGDVNLNMTGGTVKVDISGASYTIVKKNINLDISNIIADGIYGMGVASSAENINYTVNNCTLKDYLIGGSYENNVTVNGGISVTGNITMNITSCTLGKMYGGGFASQTESYVQGNVQMNLRKNVVTGIVNGGGNNVFTNVRGKVSIIVDGDTVGMIDGNYVGGGTTVILKNDPTVGEDGIFLKSLVDNRVIIEGNITARDGRIHLIANSGQYEEVVVQLPQGETNPDVMRAFKVVHKKTPLLLKFDFDNHQIRVGEQKGLVSVKATLDGMPFAGNKNLKAVDQNNINYPLYDATAGNYTTNLPKGSYVVWDGEINTNKSFTIDGTSNPTVTLEYISKTIKITGGDGSHDFVSFAGVEYRKPETVVPVIKGTSVSVNMAVKTGGTNQPKGFQDDEANKSLEEAKAGYTYTYQSKGTIAAEFENINESILASPSSVDLKKASVGYTRVNGQTVTIKNAGNVSVKVARPTAEKYVVTGFENNTNYKDGYVTLPNKGNELTFQLKSVTGLPVGIHTEKIPILIYSPNENKDIVGTTVTGFFEVVQELNFGIRGETHLVAGESTTLTPWIFEEGAGNLTYRWSTGDDTPEITVSPTADVTYSLTITDSSGASMTRDISISVEQKKYEITVEPNGMDFGAQLTGSVQPAPKKVKITNTGNVPIVLSDTLSGTGAENYTFSINEGQKKLKPWDSAEAAIQPKAEIMDQVKTYHADGIIKATGEGVTGNAEAKLKLQFVVYDAVMKVFSAKPMVIDYGSITEGYSIEAAEGKAKEGSLTFHGTGSVSANKPNLKNFIIKGDNWNSAMDVKTFKDNIQEDIKIYPQEGLLSAVGGKEYVEEDIVIKDINGDEILTDLIIKVKVNQRPEVRISSDYYKDYKIIEGTYIDLNAGITGGTAPFQYEWKVNGAKLPDNTSTIYDMPEPGEWNYEVTVTDSFGITAKASQKVTVEKMDITILAEPAVLDFGTVSEGYTILPKPQTVKLTNQGNVMVLLEREQGLFGGAGHIFTNYDDMKIMAPKDTDTFTVQPSSFGWYPGKNEGEVILSVAGTDEKIKIKTKMEVKEAPSVSINNLHRIQRGDQITLKPEVTGGITPYTYLWSTKETTSSIKISPKESTEYSLTVTDVCGSTVKIEHIEVLVSEPDYYLELTSETLDFDSAISGYTIVPEEQELTITNTGTKEVTVKQPDTKDFIIRGMNAEQKLGVGENLTVTIQPKLGLIAGTHKERLTFRTNQSAAASATISFTVIGLDESLAVEPATVEFGSTTEGYTKVPGGKSVTVINKGNTPVTVKTPTSKNYKITGFDSQKILAVGDKLSFTIEPNKGLAAGDYKEAVRLETQSAATSLMTAFHVVEAPKVNVTGMLQTVAGLPTTLTANITGGTAPYSYKWSTEDTTDKITVTPKTTTEYTVEVTDSVGVKGTGKAKVTVKDGISVVINGDTIINEGGTAALSAEVTGGIPPYLYAWNTVPIQTAKEIEVTPTDKTLYEVVVKDSLGATGSAKTTVKVAKRGAVPETPIVSIALNETSIDFGTSELGYEAESLKKEINITNSGNTSVTLKAPGSAFYQISGMENGLVLKQGERAIVTVFPKEQLSGGRHDETLVFRTQQGAKAECQLKFAVTQSVYEPSSAGLMNESIMESKNYQYGAGSISLKIEGEDGTDIVGINKTADFINTLLTPEEKRQAENGSNVTIRLRTNTIEENISRKDKEITEDALARFQVDNPVLKLGMYVDITLEKRVDSGEWEGLHETSEKLALNIQLPEEIKRLGSRFYLTRVHEGICEQIAHWDATEEKWEFDSSQFSTYAVLYVPAEAQAMVQNPQQSTVKAASPWVPYLWGILCIIILIVIIASLWYVNWIRGRKK